MHHPVHISLFSFLSSPCTPTCALSLSQCELSIPAQSVAACWPPLPYSRTACVRGGVSPVPKQSGRFFFVSCRSMCALSLVCPPPHTPHPPTHRLDDAWPEEATDVSTLHAAVGPVRLSMAGGGGQAPPRSAPRRPAAPPAVTHLAAAAPTPLSPARPPAHAGVYTSRFTPPKGRRPSAAGPLAAATALAGGPAGAAPPTTSAARRPPSADAPVPSAAEVQRQVDDFLLALPLGTSPSDVAVEDAVAAALTRALLGRARLQARVNEWAGVAAELRGVKSPGGPPGPGRQGGRRGGRGGGGPAGVGRPRLSGGRGCASGRGRFSCRRPERCRGRRRRRGRRCCRCGVRHGPR